MDEGRVVEGDHGGYVWRSTQRRELPEKVVAVHCLKAEADDEVAYDQNEAFGDGDERSMVSTEEIVVVVVREFEEARRTRSVRESSS